MTTPVFESLKPASTVLSVLYTVPALKMLTSRIIVANRGSTTAVRVAVAKNGAADEQKQYVMYDQVLQANQAISTAPIVLAAGDLIRVSSASGDVNFHCTGLLQGVT